MIVNRRLGTLTHSTFRAICDYVEPGDLLVVNDSKVIPARIRGHRRSGGEVEILALAIDERPTPVMLRSSKRLRDGEAIVLGGGRTALVRGTPIGGRGLLDFGETDLKSLLDAIGEVPLPPYIQRDGGPSAEDRERYQTVYAARDGSVAAPTAGLHFTSAVLDALSARGVAVERLTLHVGSGTFAPIRGEVAHHRMESEYCEVSAALVERIDHTRARGKRVIAVGTTTVRALESAARANGLAPFAGRTDIFIRPGHRFAACDALLTNLHLPGSTLLCLVMAFAGEELIRRAYEVAVAERYRFYSFGDAMLIV
jgi:S-adenosylmethionine:tRNA ribosyltransferase-isomerase